MKKMILTLGVAAVAAIVATGASAFSGPAVLRNTNNSASAVTPVTWYGYYHHKSYDYGHRHRYGWRHGYHWKGHYGYGYRPYYHYRWHRHW